MLVQDIAIVKRSGQVVLVVDDDAMILMGTADGIEFLGHSVIEAGSAALALEILRGGRRIDALVTDYEMPGMTGVDLAVEARRLRPGLPVLLVTGHMDLPEPARGLNRLGKPFRHAELSRQLAEMLPPPGGMPPGDHRHDPG